MPPKTYIFLHRPTFAVPPNSRSIAKMDQGLSFCYLLFLFLFLVLLSSGSVVEAGTRVTDGNTNTYIVYMGAAASSSSRVGSVPQDQAHLLASVLTRKESVEKSLLYSYKHGFSGFAARLTAEEARRMAEKPGVVSVFVDPILNLHTTRSWDFLNYQTDLKTDPTPDLDSATRGSDTIVGILDTGIWPESESFQDKDMGPIPTRWKGTCMEASDFKASNCNRKLIGARYYNDSTDGKVQVHVQSPRDTIGHGTHTASTAAGSPVANVSYYGLAEGTAKGGSTGSRIAIYKVCSSYGCRGSIILAAFDDAIRDGVDVLSLSLGASSFLRPGFDTDPIAIGAFHAVEKGIIVVCSAGNDGPSSSSVVNAAPWILTVAATTIDRDFESDCVMGNNKIVKGEGINFSTLQKSPTYPLIYGGSAKSKSMSENEARNCNPGGLDGAKIKGKIVLCEQADGSYSKREKIDALKSLGGVGMVLVDDLEKMVALSSGSFPFTVVSSNDSADILSYINSTSNPFATVLPTVTVTKYKPAPAVAYFSSRGPSPTQNIIKPDIAAPGVNILAAWIKTNDTSGVPEGQQPSQFNLLSGTSMSCPHVSGTAATIKSNNPTWSPSAIKSAIMTTAFQSNNERATITTETGLVGTAYDFGAGEINPSGALQPGLVYETNIEDYLLFLCNYGYKLSAIKNIATVIPDGFDCPVNSSTDLISNLNYPSIAISKLNEKESKKVSRSVTNVGPEEDTTYVASVLAPPELDVKVVPNKLQFTNGSKKLSYQTIFSLSSSSPLKVDAFGSITWTNGKYKVRSPFVSRSG
ncbi:CO(2)-response secreted protease-like [Macadamia integrifolia]|uniref:CO(2)-response secreted protease-like n=1 Tax=Macadamia integrifolia TaxID=60698 RepID=UPI001C4ED1F5|nr:CO(2)-response secreted protease-like [Macadamia integrifolia]